MGHAVAVLIEAGADLNVQDGSRRTALMLAAVNGCATVVKQLVDAGADILVAGQDEMTAVNFAVIGGHDSVAGSLIEARGVRELELFVELVECRGSGESVLRCVRNMATTLECVDACMLSTHDFPMYHVPSSIERALTGAHRLAGIIYSLSTLDRGRPCSSRHEPQ